MNYRQLKDFTAVTLDDLNFGYFTESQVGVWLNNAQKEVQKMLIGAAQNYYTICVQTTLVVNQRDYVLPGDFKKEHRLEVITSGAVPNENTTRLIPITINQVDLIITGVATPQFYFFKKNRLVLYPAPDTALTLRMIYTYLVTDMSADSDVPDVPEAYHELIGLLACQSGFIRDGRQNAEIESKIATYKEDLKSDAVERNQDQPRSIVITGENQEGGFYW